MPFFKKTAHNRCSVALCAVLVPILTFSLGANLVTLGTASLSMYFRERRPEFLKQALYYFGIILFFALGAGAGGNLSVRYGVHVIWVSGGLLMVSVLLMFLEKLRAWNR